MIKSVKPALINYGDTWEYGIAINNGEILISKDGNRITGRVTSVQIIEMSGNKIDNFDLLDAICCSYNHFKADHCNVFGCSSWEAPSPAQKKYAEDLLKTHCLTAPVNTKGEVEEVINRLKDKVTPNQSRKIRRMESVLGVKFTGTTKEDATAFIRKYKSIYAALSNNPNIQVKIVDSNKVVEKPKVAYVIVPANNTLDAVPLAIASNMELLVRYVDSLDRNYMNDKVIVKLPYTNYKLLEMTFKGKIVVEDTEFGAFYLV